MFFFKQKTAYEMRISDWSSDVCSSDLPYLRYWLDTTQAGSFCMVDPPEGRVADWPEEAFRTVRATYWGMISEVDRQIGRLVERLKAAGAWDSTVFALTSDHGEMMRDHCTLGNFGYFAQASHLPLILRDPPHRAGFGVREIGRAPVSTS